MRDLGLRRVLPGIGGPPYLETCGLQPNEYACRLARLNYRQGLVEQPYCCGFGVRNLACSQARKRFRAIRHEN